MEALKIESSADFYNLINSEKVVLVDFYADWCGPCKMQSPIVDELAEEAGEKFTVAKLNTDQCTDVCIKYFVSSIPTIIVFKNGEAVEKSVGLTDKAELSDMLLKHIGAKTNRLFYAVTELQPVRESAVSIGNY